jgi:hypothetical protein
MLMAGNLRLTCFSYDGQSKRHANSQKPINRGFAGIDPCGNDRKAATGFRWMPLFCRFPWTTHTL